MFASLTISTLLVAVFLALLAMAAIYDFRELRIPNWIAGTVALLYPAYVLASPVAVDWTGAAGVALAVFGVGFVLFLLGAIGGGDVKLMAAAALWAGPATILDLLLVTAIAGGALALILATPLRFVVARLFELLGRQNLRDRVLGSVVPYAAAIAVGGFIAIAPAVLSQ